MCYSSAHTSHLPTFTAGTAAQWQIFIVTAKISTSGSYLCWKAGKDIILEIVVDCHKESIQIGALVAAVDGSL